MPRLQPARSHVTVALGAVAVLVGTLLAAYSSPATATAAVSRNHDQDRDGRGAAGGPTRAERAATVALRRGQQVLAGAAGDPTMALRAVALSRDALVGQDREAADALLARPDDPGGDGFVNYRDRTQARACTAEVCVHYVTTGPDAPSPVDTNVNGRPDYVDVTLETITSVRDVYLAAGYRAPRSDGARAPDLDPRFDVYIGDVGAQQVYGFCIPDEPGTFANRNRSDRWSYCAIDNNFSTEQFGTRNSALDNLRVTVAHEYFHATQFAYDAFEDGWLLEATATWVEDEVYDAIDDNVQYLPVSQLRRPRTSLDTFDNTGFHYGTWSFFRFLTEKYPSRRGTLPRLVLDVFNRADGAPGGPDQYSWQAVNSVLRAKRTSGAEILGTYAVANRRSRSRYEEGRANRYPIAPLRGQRRVGPTSRLRTRVVLDHLATATTRFVPEDLVGRRWRLALRLDLPPTVRGSSVLVTTARRDGTVSTTRPRLDRRGDGFTRVPFSSASIAWVEVTLVNGSGRFRCASGAFSCQGRPRDDNLAASFTASAVR